MGPSLFFDLQRLRNLQKVRSDVLEALDAAENYLVQVEKLASIHSATGGVEVGLSIAEGAVHEHR